MSGSRDAGEAGGAEGGSEALALAVERLEAAYQRTAQHLAREYPDYQPEEILDSSGRSILLDALTAIVTARTALDQSHAAPPAQTAIVQPGDTLILRYERTFLPTVAEQIKAAVIQRLPGVEVMVIGGCQQITAYRPEPEQQP